MLRPEERHIIFRTGRPTNYKLGTQTEHEDPHQRQVLAVTHTAPRSKVKFTWLNNAESESELQTP